MSEIFDEQKFDMKMDNFISGIKNKAQKQIALDTKKELIKNYKGADQAVSFKSIYEKIKQLPPQVFVKTGFLKLDEKLGGGLYEGELVLVSGTSGHGKTSFCFDMTRNMEKQNCFWLPFEESAEEFARKTLYWKKDPIHFYTPEIIGDRDDFPWIEDRVLEAVLKYNSKVIFIDNLQFLTMGEASDWAKTAFLAKNLKKLAQKTKTVIILIVHINKLDKTRLDVMPNLQDITGSSDIYKVADKSICVWRVMKKEGNEMKYTGQTRVQVQKVRQAGGDQWGSVDFNWEKGVYIEDSLQEKFKEFADVPKENKDF